MKKILIAINTLGTGGAEKAMISFLNTLIKEDVEVDLEVILNQGELINEIPDCVNLLNKNFDKTSISGSKGQWHLIKNTIKLFFCRAAIFRLFPFFVSNLLIMLRQRCFAKDKLLWQILAMGATRTDKRYDLAIAFTEGGATYYVDKFVNSTKKVSFVHVAYKAAGYYPAIDSKCYDGMDRILCVSKEVRSTFLECYPTFADKVKVFDNILELSKIQTLASKGRGFEDIFDGLRILTVGRLAAQKSIDRAVYAMDLLVKKGLNARWYIIGDGEERNKLERLIRAKNLEDNIVILGVKENPFPYVENCDLFVNVSSYEGKSIAIQEAQILKRAVIATKCPGNMEQIIDGYDGLMCEESCESICEAIEKLLADKELRVLMGERAYEKITKQCSADRGKEEVIELLNL